MTEIIPQTDKTLKQEHSLLKEPTANPSAPKRDLQPKTQMQATEQETSKIPPKPVMSAEAAAKTANVDYRDKSDRWEERYGEKAQRQEKSISSGM